MSVNSETPPTRMDDIPADAGEDIRSILSEPFAGQDVLLPARATSLELMVKELQHRIRNLLCVVQSFVSSTEAESADGYRAALTARIAALADAHGLIESAREHRVSLAELLELTLRPHAMVWDDRIVLAGPDITIEPQTALLLHMVFHELATNASKHGALTSASGSVEVLWETLPKAGARAVAIQWRERGGPKVGKPERQGFGLQLIARALSGGQVDMDFAQSGLICRLLLEMKPSSELRKAAG